MLLDGYVRVSQVRGRAGDRFISPQVQADKIRAWAALHDHQIGQVVEELDESGARKDRPLLQATLERIEAGEVQGVIVARLDRFGRSLVDSLAAIDRIEKAGGIFASVDDGFDISTDTGRLVLRLMLSLAEFELDRVRATFDTARERAVARGIHPSPVPPFGYRRDEDDDGHVLGPLDPDPVTGPLVTELYRRSAGGESWADLARWLDQTGARTAYANDWTGRGVRDLVRNRVYLGEARHGQYVNKQAHPALTDQITYERAQRRGRAVGERNGELDLLTGLIRCAGCRYTMSATPTRSGGRQYRCRRQFANGRCPDSATVSHDIIEPWIERQLFDAVGNVTAAAPATDRSVLADLEQELQDANAALAVFRDDQVIDVLGAQEYAAGLKIRQERVDDLRDRVFKERDRMAPPFPVLNLEAAWPDLAVSERRKLVALVFDCVFVRSGRTRNTPIDAFVHLCPAGTAPADLPRRGRPTGPIVSFVFPGQDAP